MNMGFQNSSIDGVGGNDSRIKIQDKSKINRSAIVGAKIEVDKIDTKKVAKEAIRQASVILKR
jgi:hypothetical protein